MQSRRNSTALWVFECGIAMRIHLQVQDHVVLERPT
jgi:hypothetical protein